MCASARSNARTTSPALCWVRTVRVTLSEELVGSAAWAPAGHPAPWLPCAHSQAWHQGTNTMQRSQTSRSSATKGAHKEQTFRWHMASCPRRPVKGRGAGHDARKVA